MTARDIPTARFNSILRRLLREGWHKTYEYDNFDAWIDYGEVIFERGGLKVTCRWDNWTEGAIEGPNHVLAELGLSSYPRSTS